MNAAEVLMFRFMLASAACLAAGLAVWALSVMWSRLPGLAAQRTTWLLSQATIAATLCIVMLPHSERLRLLPPIELPDTVAAALSDATAPHAIALAAQPGAAVADAAPAPWPTRAAQTWLALYLFGLAYAIARLVHGRHLLRGLAAAGQRLATPAGHPALTVIEVDAPVSPMLFGFVRPCLLLPRHLRHFDPLQQQLIVEHELTHLRRHDLHWMNLSILLQTLLWFNPFMRLLRAKLGWAQELGCDRDVLRKRPGVQRKAYAGALLAQLKLQHSMQHQRGPAALAFGAVDAGSLTGRIAFIREPGTHRHASWARLGTLVALAGIFVGSLALQPALAGLDTASAVPAGPYSCTDIADADGRQLVHEGRCDERVTPASTFNIAVSLMGYDSGILQDEHTPRLPFKAGYPDWIESWRAPTDPTSWIANSVVWYAQQVTARLGHARFEQYVNQLNYGNRDVSGDPGKDNGLAMSWISSSLRISPVEQVAFMRRIVNRTLPVSARAYDMTARLMTPVTLSNGWVVQGKTGTAYPILPDGRDDEAHQYGWYVGWAKKGTRTIVFAHLIQDRKREDAPSGPRARQAFLHDLQTRLGQI